MSPTHATILSTGVCLFAAALEGVCAGKNVKAYFASLRRPRYSAPLWFWYFIGGAYYVSFFIVLYRLFRLESSSLRTATLTLVFFMMVANGLWNLVFFRAQRLFLSFFLGSLAPLFDVTLFLCLIELDKTAAWALVPYLLYRLYALWWGYGLWKVNRTY